VLLLLGLVRAGQQNLAVLAVQVRACHVPD
jgi:hypothetical protein